MSSNLNIIPKNLILSSTESVRKKVLDRISEYEELQGVDLSKTNFLTYMINMISLLSSDNASALSLSKRENYLVTANFPSSIYNWASYLSYAKEFAKPAIASVLLQIPLDFTENAIFEIPMFSSFKAGQIIYTNDQERFAFIYDKASNTLSGKAISEVTVKTLKVLTQNNVAYTAVSLKQLEKSEETHTVPYDLQPYQPYSFPINYKDSLAGIELYIRSNNVDPEEQWEFAGSFFDMGLGEKKFAFKYESAEKIRIMFGNDVFGRQPTPGSLIRVVLYTTKASKGSVIANSITKMDRIYYMNSQGVATQVTINPVNVSASSLGVDDETLEETKRKSRAKFRARQRVLSEPDFGDITDIIENFPFAHVKSILKRSDVKTNEIVLYVTLPKEYRTYEPQILDDVNRSESTITQTIPMPTNSISQSISNAVNLIKPYSVFTDNGYDYICPFGIVKESASNAYYYYMVKNADVTPDVHTYDQVTYPLSYLNLNLKSDEEFENVTFTLTYDNYNNVVNMANITTNLYLKFRTDIKGPYNCVIDDVLKTISVTVPSDDIITDSCSIEFHIMSLGVNISVVKNEYYIKRNLKSYMYSTVQAGPSTSTIYDIPCILKDYYVGMTDEERTRFEVGILQSIISTTNLSDYRMMNTSLNIKFLKTHGIASNYDYNRPTMPKVKDILNDPPVSPVSGDRYIVGSKPTGVWTNHQNKVALWTGSWVFFDSEPGSIVEVTNQGRKYTLSGNGNRWINPVFKIPYEVEIYVYAKDVVEDDSSIINVVKKHFMYTMIPYMGVETEQQRSIMYKAIQDLKSYVDYCEIRIPEVNIVFDYNILDFNSATLKGYVPQYIYTDIEHINVKVVRR